MSNLPMHTAMPSGGLNVAKFYSIVDLIRSLDKEGLKQLDSFHDQLVKACDEIDEEGDALAKANNALLAEVRMTTRRQNPFSSVEEQEDIFADLRHTVTGKNFLRVIFDVIRSIQVGFRSMRDMADGLRPGSLVLSKKSRLTEEDLLEPEKLQQMLIEYQMNSATIDKFMSGVLRAETAKHEVIALGRLLTDKLDGYYQTLLHRHSIEGIQIHRDPVTTDVAISIFENVDAHGEIADGKKPDEISAYSVRKAIIIADSIKDGLVGEFIQHPAKLLDFMVDHLQTLWELGKMLSEMAKPIAARARAIIGPSLRKHREMSDSEFEQALIFLKDLDPQRVTYKEKTGLLTAEERFEVQFKNQTLERVTRLLSDPTSKTEELIQYILQRKHELKEYYQDENSFYVCKIGNGNPFTGDAPGELTVVPGARPVVNLDEIVGAGFDEVKSFMGQVEASSKWHDIFVALSPSRTADKSNVLLIGPQGCHRKGQKVLMHDGTLLAVENVQVGDLLMGPDSKPRTVQKLVRGTDTMVEIIPTKGKPWVVNRGHFLTLVRTQKKVGNWGGKPKYTAVHEVKDVAVSEYLTWSKTQKHIHPLFRVPVDFAPAAPLPLEPYFLGVLLGDGCLRDRVAVTNADPEIVKEVYVQAGAYSLHVNIDKPEATAPSYHLSGPKGKANPITTILRGLDLFGRDSETKFIPYIYKTASREDRLELLAGLIDTDGDMVGNCHYYTSKSLALADDLAFVARSLGFAAYVSPCQKKDQNGTWGTYHRVTISGETSEIPVRVEYKQAQKRRQVKDVLRTGFKTRELPPENYFGFVLDGDHRYLLDDFTVTHNCGKSEVLRAVGSDKKSIGVFATGSDFLTCWKGEAEKNPKRLFEAALRIQKESKKHVHILIDEIDTILSKETGRDSFGGTNLVTEFQNLMDGVVHYPNISVWGATNNPERIPMPCLRRFSKVWIVGELDQKSRVQLLKHFASFMPLSAEFTDEAWESLARELDGATGDVLRKVVDYVWREKTTWLTENHAEESRKLLDFLNQGEKFDIKTFSAKRRQTFHDRVRPFMTASPKDLARSIEIHLENVSITHEIRTARETYDKAKRFLSSLKRNGAPQVQAEA